VFGGRNRGPDPPVASYSQEHGDRRYDESSESAEEEERIEKGDHTALDSGTQLLEGHAHMD
jgi:hypothetical protein